MASDLAVEEVVNLPEDALADDTIESSSANQSNSVTDNSALDQESVIDSVLNVSQIGTSIAADTAEIDDATTDIVKPELASQGNVSRAQDVPVVNSSPETENETARSTQPLEQVTEKTASTSEHDQNSEGQAVEERKPHITPLPTHKLVPSITHSVASSTINASPANNGQTSSMLFVSKALESILASREGKRQSALQISLKNALEQIKKLSPDAPAPSVIYEPLRLATLANSNEVKSIALDTISKLFSFSFLIDVPETPVQITEDVENAVPQISTRTMKLVEQGVETVCDCFKGDSTDEAVELQVIKALLAAVLNEKLIVHGAALLKAIRQTYNIFILSRSNANQAIAQTTLTQMVNVVFDRVKTRINSKTASGEQDVVDIATAVNAEFEAKKLEFDARDDRVAEADERSVDQEKSKESAETETKITNEKQNAVETVNGESKVEGKITLESFENRKSFDEERPEVISGELKDEDELFVRDAFLVFRAMCKLSIKAIDASDNKADMRSHAMRSKLLSLHLVYTILNTHITVFTSSNVIIRSSASSEQTIFIHAIRQYLCLCLSRNAASPIPAIFEVCCDIFWLILVNLRSQLKKEIEVFWTEIYMPILEMKNSTPHQKQYLLHGVEKLCNDPRALVEIYLNYDCDNTALDNIYERLIEYFSRISVTPISLSAFQLQQYQENQKNPHNSVFGSTVGPGGVAIPPSFSTQAVSALQSNPVDNPSVPLDYTLKRIALDCLVAVLRSLVQWSQQGIAEARGELGLSSTTRDSDSIVDEDSRPGTVTPSSSYVGTASPLPERTPSSEARISTPTGIAPPIDDPSQFESFKQRKTLLLEAIKQFNFKPKRGIAALIDRGFITSKEPNVIAQFLLTTEGLSKAMIGEYLGEGDAENVAIMHAFVDLMDFTDMKFVDALRLFLQAFRLPGEAQKIDRFVLKFAERYISGNPSIFANADTAYVLAYSVILLNTDLHSPQVKNRMTKQDFFKNNRGINDNADLPEALLSETYDEILNNEIILKEEHDGALMSNQLTGGSIATNIGQVLATVGRDLQREAYLQASKEMANKTELLFKNLVRTQRKDQNASSRVVFYSASHIEHVGPMFEVVWMSFLAGLSGPMQDTEDLEIIDVCMDGIKLAIRIACLFDIELARISFVTGLSKFTNLQNLSEMKAKHVEGIKTLLEVALSEGNLLKDSWKNILTCVSQLERFQLISSGISEGAIPDLNIAKIASRESFESTRSRTSTFKSVRSRSASIVTPFSSAVAEETRAREIVIAMDKIFTQSSQLSGEAIVYFVSALTEVSREEIQSSGHSEHPRTFSLQKMVDVSYYNMDRIRVEWSSLWAIMGEQFNQVGCHPNISVVYFALDSLRQLSIRFLELEELSHFRFQKDFLRPFEHVITNNPNISVKDMVLRCLQQMILSRAKNIRSGWSTMFGVFTFAAKDQNEQIVQLAFENIKTIHNEDFDLVMAQGSFADLAVCLTEMAKNYKFQKISLHAIELLRSSIPLMLAYQKSVQAGLNGNYTANKASIEDPAVKFWFPVLFAFHDIIMTGEDLEVRSRALNYLFDTLVEYGHDFQPDFWDLACRQLLFPIFIVLKSRSEMSRFNNHEDMSVWLSTTMIQALRNLIALFTHYFETLERMLDGFLDLLITCICQENDTLARIGSSCLQQLILENVKKFRKDHWTQIVQAFVTLFETTTAYQLFLSQGEQPPVTPLAESIHSGLKINGLSYPLLDTTIEEVHREQLGDDSVPTSLVRVSDNDGNEKAYGHVRGGSIVPGTGSPNPDPNQDSVAVEKKREFNKIIVKCVLQLLMIETVSELFNNDDVYNNIPSEELLILMQVLRKSFQFARKFNNDKDLRIKLWKDGFMKQLPNLLKQESSAASTYIRILLRMYHDTNQDRIENKENIEDALIPLCVDIINGYAVLDEETQQRNIAAWKPVVVEVIQGYLDFQQDDFARHVEVFYPLGVDLLSRDHGKQIRVTLQLLFGRIGTVWMKGKSKKYATTY
ncbi:hypothetical protein V1514DRAFT_290241 [Lipomyces japonicus]|uniref:uncharacterized protein n=1 Tax=Lipomyces japonicus TaxID=56871 RepID=UPI0034D00BCD